MGTELYISSKFPGNASTGCLGPYSENDWCMVVQTLVVKFGEVFIFPYSGCKGNRQCQNSRLYIIFRVYLAIRPCCYPEVPVTSAGWESGGLYCLLPTANPTLSSVVTLVTLEAGITATNTDWPWTRRVAPWHTLGVLMVNECSNHPDENELPQRWKRKNTLLYLP